MIDNTIDMLTCILNAQKVKRLNVELYGFISKKSLNVLKLLMREGFIRSYNVKWNKNKKKFFVNVFLKYDSLGRPAVKNVSFLSKSSRRFYTSIKTLSKFNNGLGIYLISTPKGILSDLDCRILNTGGEVICYIF